MDYVVAHYTDDELLELLEVDTPSETIVAAAAIDKQQRHADDPDLARFFGAVGEYLSKKYAPTRVVTRLVTIDSAFRENIDALNTSDHFTFLLSEPLYHVTAMSLYSVELHQTWYAFSAAKGNTSVVLKTLDDGVPVTTTAVIADGNYTAASLLAAVAAALNHRVTATLNPVNGLVSLTGAFDRTAILTFFDAANPGQSRANKNLGWNMGFRTASVVFEPVTELESHTVTATSPVLVTATRYITMKLDDFSQSRFNNSTVQIGRGEKKVRSATSTEIRYRGGTGELLSEISAPRRLTSKQIYSLNASAVSAVATKRSYDDPDTDVFAKVPLKHLDCGDFGKAVIEFSGPLQLNTRDYPRPVLLTSMSVSLYDDKNNLLGLNGCDWSFSLLVKQLV